MKKADVAVTVYFRIFEILLLVMVVTIVYNHVSNIEDSGIYQKKFLSRDLALLVDSFANARGNVQYAYDTPLATLSRFTYDFSGGTVSVDGDQWPYAAQKDFVPPKPLVRPEQIILQQQAGALSITDAAMPFNNLLLNCPGGKLGITGLLVDPGKGMSTLPGGETQGTQGAVWAGTDGTPIAESNYLRNTALSIKAQLAGKNVLATRSLELDEAKTIAQRIALAQQEANAAILSLHAGTDDAKENIARIFVHQDSPASARWGCVLANALAQAYPGKLTGTAVIPVNPEHLAEDDARKILLPDRIAVLIETGNAAFPQNPPLNNPRVLAGALAQGVREA